MNQRWLGGMLTNWTTMKARIDRLKDLERMESSGAIAMRPMKEGAVLRRRLERLQKYLGGLKTCVVCPTWWCWWTSAVSPTPSWKRADGHSFGFHAGYQLRSGSL